MNTVYAVAERFGECVMCSLARAWTKTHIYEVVPGETYMGWSGSNIYRVV